MDKKTILILNLGKYGGYIAVFWVTYIIAGYIYPGLLILLFLIFALDNIRTYYLEAKLPGLVVPSLYSQAVLAFAYIYFEGSPLGGILLIILTAESLLAHPHPHGDYIFFMALTGFPAVSFVSLYWRSELNWGSIASIMINCLFIFFAYGVSFMARRQREEKERAEDALEQLERSRTDLEQAYLKLIEVSKEREYLAAAEERSRLARELHDTLAHSLTAIVVTLEAAKKLMKQNPGKALEEIEKSQEQARRGLEEVRLTIKVMRPLALDEMGFHDALKSIARDYSGSGAEISFDFDENTTLSAAQEAAFYRIIQECITNSVRHGKAGNIYVRMRRQRDDLFLTIEDDGAGCAALSEGQGMRGIRERAAALGGEVVFENRREGGFNVTVLIRSIPDE